MRKYLPAIGLFLALNWLDYANLGDIFRHGKIRYLALMLVPLIFTHLKPKLSWAPALFASLALFSWTIHDFPLQANFQLLQIFGVMFAASYLVGKGADWFGNLLCLSGAFQAVVALLQVCGIHIFFTPALMEDMHTPVGFSGHESVLGAFLVACLPAALWRGWFYAAFLMIVAILATCSAMAWGSLGAIATIFIWHLAGFRSACALAFLGLALLGLAELLFPGNALMSFHGRFFIWPFGFRAIREHPLFGSGLGGWRAIYIPRFKDEILAVFHYHLPVQLHCDYLDFIVEYGLLGSAAFLCAIGQFIRNFRPTWHHAACAAVLVNSLGNFSLCLVNTALIFVVCWAHSAKYGSIAIEEMDA